MRHPTIPADLLAEYGDPEQAFGPNNRTRTGFVVIGGASLIFGGLLYAAWICKVPVGQWFSTWVATAMMVGGAVVLYGAWKIPMSWVFVCPRGLVRKRGSRWEGRDWSEAVRFEDATIGYRGSSIRQSRLVWNFGPEWGFIADTVADYDR
ncbi:MAG: hypothetical protein ABGY75_10045, partial [Gemmataceae bacterium]